MRVGLACSQRPFASISCAQSEVKPIGDPQSTLKNRLTFERSACLSMVGISSSRSCPIRNDKGDLIVAGVAAVAVTAVALAKLVPGLSTLVTGVKFVKSKLDGLADAKESAALIVGEMEHTTKLVQTLQVAVSKHMQFSLRLTSHGCRANRWSMLLPSSRL